MCVDLYALTQEAEKCGWWGHSEGPGPDKFMVYQCGCDDEHLVSYVANEADDPDYYRLRCDFIRQCDVRMRT